MELFDLFYIFRERNELTSALLIRKQAAFGPLTPSLINGVIKTSMLKYIDAFLWQVNFTGNFLII